MLRARFRTANRFFDELQAVAPHRFDPATCRNLAGLSRMEDRAASARLHAARKRYATASEVIRFADGEEVYDPKRLWTASVAAELAAHGAEADPSGAVGLSQARRAVQRAHDYFAAPPFTTHPVTTYDFDDVVKKIAEGIMDAFDDLGSSLDEIRMLARGHSLQSWREERMLKAAALAAPSAIGGPMALAYLPVEVAALMRFTFNAVIGVGFIRNGAAWRDDFLNTFYVLSNENIDFDARLRSQVVAKLSAMGAAHAAVAVSTQAGAQLLSTAIVNTLLLKAGSKIAPPVLAKISAKLAAWLSGPTVAKWIPLVGAAVSAGINSWVTSTLIDGADRYYAFLRRVADDV
ncbi:MAG: hypothetical protein GC187_01585 [Alphaproteobacteria bacterium]|nr:hypothetical protein [Alphaproteobacteria bacterium]